MSGYTLYAVATGFTFRVFATTTPVDARTAGRIAARRFRELGLPVATAAGVSPDRPTSHVLLLANDRIVHAIASLESERVDELRRLAAVGEGALLLVAVEPLETMTAIDMRSDTAWCPRCLDHLIAPGERRCRACSRLDALLKR